VEVAESFGGGADGHDVAVLERVLLDQLAVDVRAVGAVEVFEERVVEDVDDQRVMAAHRGIVDADVVVRQPANRVTLLVHVVFGHDRTIEAKDQPCHVQSSELACLSVGCGCGC
jgi:hypothetical protein